jgi:hypothetical protein
MTSSDKTLEISEKRLDAHKFIILKASDIGYLEEDGSFIKLAILKEDINEAIYANRITIELGKDDD